MKVSSSCAKLTSKTKLVGTYRVNTVIMNKQFFRKRWLDFRNGHSIYLGFLLTFVNFILIAYHFAIQGVPLLHGVFDSLALFTLIFMAIYVPAAMLIGYWHRKNQYSVENEAMLQENWLWAWLARYQIRLIEGKTTPEESNQIMRYLESILKRQKKDSLLSKPSSEELPDV